MIQALDEKRKLDLSVITVNVDVQGTDIAGTMAEYNLGFPVLLDPQLAATRLYRFRYIPATFLIDRDGVVRDRVFGGFKDLEDIESRIKRVTP